MTYAHRKDPAQSRCMNKLQSQPTSLAKIGVAANRATLTVRLLFCPVDADALVFKDEKPDCSLHLPPKLWSDGKRKPRESTGSHVSWACLLLRHIDGELSVTAFTTVQDVENDIRAILGRMCGAVDFIVEDRVQAPSANEVLHHFLRDRERDVAGFVQGECRQSYTDLIHANYPTEHRFNAVHRHHHISQPTFNMPMTNLPRTTHSPLPRPRIKPASPGTSNPATPYLTGSSAV
jgi:hypothetical protein